MFDDDEFDHQEFHQDNDETSDSDPNEIERINNLLKFVCHYCCEGEKDIPYKTISSTARYRQSGTLLLPKGEKRTSTRFKYTYYKKKSKSGALDPPPESFHPLFFLESTPWLEAGSNRRIATQLSPRPPARHSLQPPAQRRSPKPSTTARPTSTMTIDNFTYQLFADEPMKNPIGVFCHKFYNVMGDDNITMHDKMEIALALQATDMADFIQAKLSNDGKSIIVTIPQFPEYMLHRRYISTVSNACTTTVARTNLYMATQAQVLSLQVDGTPPCKTLVYMLPEGSTYNNTNFNRYEDGSTPGDEFELVTKFLPSVKVLGESTTRSGYIKLPERPVLPTPSLFEGIRSSNEGVEENKDNQDGDTTMSENAPPTIQRQHYVQNIETTKKIDFCTSVCWEVGIDMTSKTTRFSRNKKMSISDKFASLDIDGI